MADPFTFAIATIAQIGISYLFPSQGPRMQDLRISASTYGAAIPNAFGTCRVAGNLIWAMAIVEHKHKTFGKGGFTETYTYTDSFAMAFCRGPATAIRKLWADGKLIYDSSGESPLAVDTKFKFHFYLGGEDQLPDSRIEADKGVGTTPAYRDLAYVMFEDMDLSDFGNRIPQFTAEVFVDAAAVSVGAGPYFIPVDSNRWNAGIAVDADRGYIYTTTGGQTVRRFRITDGQEDLQNSDIPQPDQIVGVSPTTGNIILNGYNASNSGPMYELEPNGLGLIDQFGGFSSGFQFPKANPGCFADDVNGNEFAFYPGLGGSWVIFPTYPDFGRKDGATPNWIPGGVSVYAETAACGSTGLPLARFYVWYGGASSGALVPTATLAKLEPSDDTKNPDSWTATTIFEFTPDPTRTCFPGIALYDASDNGILLVWHYLTDNIRHVMKYSIDTGQITWSRDDVQANIDNLGPTTRITQGQVMWIDGNNMYCLNTLTGQYVKQVNSGFAAIDYNDPTEVPIDVAQPDDSLDTYAIPLDATSPASFQVFDPSRRVLVTTDGSTGRILRPTVNPGDTSLKDFIQLILMAGGLPLRNMDLDALASINIRGYGWATETDVKSMISQMQQLYMFDLVEVEGKLTAVLRSDGTNETTPGAPVRSIKQMVLGSTSDTALDYWQETRIQDADLPVRVSLTYMNFDQDYLASAARSARITNPVPTMFSNQQVAMEINVVMTATEAKNQVNKILWSQWAERSKHQTRLPWAYLNLDPADIVSVTLDDGRTYNERIQHTEIGSDFAIATETVSQDGGAYVSNAVGDGGSGPTSPVIDSAPPAKPFVLNTPLLRDADDTGGGSSLYYTAIGKGAPGPFKGATFYRSVNNQDYATVYLTDNDVEWAQVNGVIPTPRHGVFALDWDTQITMWGVSDGFALESITDDDLWNGANICVIGNEVMQFRDAVQNANGSWTIWNLLRGRRGTEYACGAHTFGEPFVFLSSKTIQAEAETIDARGQQRWFKAVGEQRALVNTPALPVNYEPRDLMPYAPQDIRRTISGTDITVTWRRRTRMGGNMQDFTGAVPLNEAAEAYEFYVLSEAFDGDLSRGGTLPTTIIYSGTTTEQTIVLPTSGFTASFDVNLDTLHVLVYQVSATVGRGFPGTRSIQPWQAF